MAPNVIKGTILSVSEIHSWRRDMSRLTGFAMPNMVHQRENSQWHVYSEQEFEDDRAFLEEDSTLISVLLEKSDKSFIFFVISFSSWPIAVVLSLILNVV